ncbi:MAG TPA: hypothetical protein VLL76_08720, partial [Candidatus Omnitrophota bacterium]|nr:hypothetical protein [Candidatus Omnitrophota bacterium]
MIDPKDLEAYKFSLQQELEKFKYDRQCELEHYKEKMLRERHDWLFSQTGAVELMRGVISLALLSLRSLIVVNGGAVIAILTFSGNLFSRADCRAMAKA